QLRELKFAYDPPASRSTVIVFSNRKLGRRRELPPPSPPPSSLDLEDLHFRWAAAPADGGGAGGGGICLPSVRRVQAAFPVHPHHLHLLAAAVFPAAESIVFALPVRRYRSVACMIHRLCRPELEL